MIADRDAVTCHDVAEILRLMSTYLHVTGYLTNVVRLRLQNKKTALSLTQLPQSTRSVKLYNAFFKSPLLQCIANVQT